ncbi:MAG: hypothetical protein WCP10_08820 [Desulfuromonadales bacterium]
MSSRDWRIFLWSWFIGNGYWAVTCWLGVSALEWVWRVVNNGINFFF